MLNEFGPYVNSLDPTVIKNDQTRKSMVADCCSTDTSPSGLHPPNVSRPNIAVPSTTWNYNPYIGNLYNYYSNQPYDLGDVSHQYAGQKCNSQYARAYGQPLSSTSVLQCCDPRCQLLSKHSMYPSNTAYCNKVPPPQKPRRPTKPFISSIYEVPKPELAKTSEPVAAKFSSCVPYSTHQNDLSNKYSHLPNYNSQYQSAINPSQPLFISDASSLNEYYPEPGKAGFWNTKQNLWNHNGSGSYYSTVNADKNVDQKLSASHHEHSNFGASNQHSRGILLNHLLENGGRACNNNSYFTSYHPSNLNPLKNDPPLNYEHEQRIYTENMCDTACVSSQDNVMQISNPPYNIRYLAEGAISNDSYQETPTRQSENYSNSVKKVSGKTQSLDVREFLSTWDESEDEKPVDSVANETSVIVLDYTSQENSTLPKDLEKFNNSVKTSEYTNNIHFQPKLMENDKMHLAHASPHTSVIQGNNTDILINSTSKLQQSSTTESNQELTQINSDPTITWYTDLKKKGCHSYDVGDPASSIPKNSMIPHSSASDSGYQLLNKRNIEKYYMRSEYSENIDKKVFAQKTSNDLCGIHNQYPPQYRYDIHRDRSINSHQQGGVGTPVEQEYSYPEGHSLHYEKNAYCLNLQKPMENLVSLNHSKEAVPTDCSVGKIQDYSLKNFHYDAQNVFKGPESETSSSTKHYKHYGTSNLDYYPHSDTLNQNPSLQDNITSFKENAVNDAYNRSTHKKHKFDSDVMLVKSGLENSLEGIQSNYGVHLEPLVSTDSELTLNNKCIDESQREHCITQSMPEMYNPTESIGNLSETERETSQSEVESSYNGVIQKIGTCPHSIPPSKDDDCENSLLSMPSLSPPTPVPTPKPQTLNDPAKECKQPIDSSNLTLNDVYENNVIFDTENTNIDKTEYENPKNDESTPNVEAYQPLNLALTKNSIQNNESISISNLQIYSEMEGPEAPSNNGLIDLITKADDCYYPNKNNTEGELSSHNIHASCKSSSISDNPSNLEVHNFSKHDHPAELFSILEENENIHSTSNNETNLHTSEKESTYKKENIDDKVLVEAQKSEVHTNITTSDESCKQNNDLKPLDGIIVSDNFDDESGSTYNKTSEDLKKENNDTNPEDLVHEKVSSSCNQNNDLKPLDGIIVSDNFDDESGSTYDRTREDLKKENNNTYPKDLVHEKVSSYYPLLPSPKHFQDDITSDLTELDKSNSRKEGDNECMKIQDNHHLSNCSSFNHDSSTQCESKSTTSPKCQATENMSVPSRDSTIWYTKAQLKEMSFPECTTMDSVCSNYSNKSNYSYSNQATSSPTSSIRNLNNSGKENTNQCSVSNEIVLLTNVLNEDVLQSSKKINKTNYLEGEKITDMLQNNSTNKNCHELTNNNVEDQFDPHLTEELRKMNSSSVQESDTLDVNYNCINNSTKKLSTLFKQTRYKKNSKQKGISPLSNLLMKSEQKNDSSSNQYFTDCDNHYQSKSEKVVEESNYDVESSSNSISSKRKLSDTENVLPMKKRKQERISITTDIFIEDGKQCNSIERSQKHIGYNIEGKSIKYKQKSKNITSKLKERYFKKSFKGHQKQQTFKKKYIPKIKRKNVKHLNFLRNNVLESAEHDCINVQSLDKVNLDSCNNISKPPEEFISSEPEIVSDNNSIKEKSLTDDFFNIPSVAPTPHCDIGKDDTIDFDDLHDGKSSCSDDDNSSQISTHSSILNAPTPNCDLSIDDDSSHNTIPNNFTAHVPYGHSDNHEKISSRAPSPCCVLSDITTIHKEILETQYIDVCSQFRDVSPQSSVAPSPHCDIIEGVLLEDSTDMSHDDEEIYSSEFDLSTHQGLPYVFEVPTLRELAFMALQSLETIDLSSNSRKLIDVRVTKDQTEIIIYSEESCTIDDTFTKNTDGDIMLTEASYENREGGLENLAIENDPLLDRSFNFETTGNQQEADEELQCRCLIISSEDPVICLRCSLSSSVQSNENNSTVSLLVNEHDENENNLHLYENIQSRFSNSCIEETFIDQKLSVPPDTESKTSDTICVDDSPKCPDAVEVFDNSVPCCYKSKIPITVKVPWYKIFKLDNLCNTNGAQEMLELGPAQIEIRLSSDKKDTLKIPVHDLGSRGYSPVLKVKRLILQPAAKCIEDRKKYSAFDATNLAILETTTSEEDRKREETVVVEAETQEESEVTDVETCNKLHVTDTDVCEESEFIECNDDAVEELVGVPRMVIRKTSCEEYQSYLQTSLKKLQPVVRLYRSKSLDELALMFIQNEDICNIEFNKVERRTSSCELRSCENDGTVSQNEPENEVEISNTDIIQDRTSSTPALDIDVEDTFVSETSLLPKTKQYHCLLCHRSYSSEELYHLHVKSKLHRHLELTQRKTIHAMYRHFTGNMCPRLRPLSAKERKKMKWKPRNANVNHIYHQKTPLQIALHKSVKLNQRYPI